MADHFNVLDSAGQLFARRTADHAGVTSSTTLVDDGVLLLSVAASAIYIVRGLIIYTAAAAGDIKLGWVGPSGATFDWTPAGLTTTASASAGALRMPAKAITDTDIPGGVDVSTPVAALPSGLLVTSTTPGTFKLQYAQGASDAGATTVKAGSWLLAERVA